MTRMYCLALSGLIFLGLFLHQNAYSFSYDAAPADTAGASASSTAELLRILLENGTITREQYNRLMQRQETDISDDLLDQDDDFGYSDVDVRTRRFRVRSDDGRDLFRLRGRLFLDGAYLNLNDNKNTVDDPRDGRGDLGNYGTIIRSARLGAEGVMYEDFLWRLDLDFRDQEIRFRGSYIEYIRLNPFRIMVGHMKEPMGLEWMTTRRSSTFIERASSSEAYKPDWQMGIRLEYRGSRYNLMGGVFSGGETFRQRTVTDGYAFTGRATVAPYLRGSSFVHVGAAASYRVNSYTQRIDGQFNRQYIPVRLRTRLGTRAIDGRFIGDDDINNAVDLTRLTGEAAFGLGSFSVQGEATTVGIRRDFGNPDLTLSGYYVQASYFLTGETRTYRPFRGNFGALIPNRNFRPGFGPGAIELAARFSSADSIDEDYDGGKMDHFTFGVNWYLNREIRFLFNYIYLEAESMNGKKSTGSVFAVRFQLEF